MAISEASLEQKPYEPLNPNHPRLAIKHGQAFLLTDLEGTMPDAFAQGFGFYHDDTRWLRRWQLKLNDKTPLLLNSDASAGYAAQFIYSNEAGVLPAQSLMIDRDLVINEGLTERVTVKNFSSEVAVFELVLHFDNDFADMFEVRGTKRAKRGTLHPAQLSADRRRVVLSYTGLDGLLRETFIDFPRMRPTVVESGRAVFSMKLKRHSSRELLFKVSTRIGGGDLPLPRARSSYSEERGVADARYEGWVNGTARIKTENVEFNAVVDRACRDVYILRQESKFGTCLAAGVPWFAVPFGRDDFITALQTVTFMPELAREILTFFSHYQGKKFDEELAEEPGKMPHEIRTGEMANCAEIAFRPYYGTVDATQLWLMLLWAYVSHTGDLMLANELWSNVERADQFLTSATRSGADFIRYGGKPGQALSNQGWKDSGNAIVHADGSLAKAPIAVCEAQGYLYSAWIGASKLAALLKRDAYASELQGKAELLKKNFGPAFWMENKKFPAIAVDGDGRQCDVISSNPGHLLGTGILSRERELEVADRLLEKDMFSGWGVRTLASSEIAYQPMDYQLGSVWPHDSGFSAAQMPKIGRANHAHAIMRGLFDAARESADYRLPELFCGFERASSSAPVRYPVACVPQAWAAGCWMHMLAGCMNIDIDGLNNRVTISAPRLPSWLGTVTVSGLRVLDSEMDLEFTPSPNGSYTCRVTRIDGDIECVIS